MNTQGGSESMTHSSMNQKMTGSVEFCFSILINYVQECAHCISLVYHNKRVDRKQFF